MPTRRDVVLGLGAVGVIGCARPADWCEAPQIIEDGPFPGPDTCVPTVESLEGPFYRGDAPEQADMNIWGDEGTVIRFSGRVLEGDCSTGLAGATVELWHADPSGAYDNRSSDMRYRCALRTDDDGRYSVVSLLPGRYLNGSSYRPRHIHVKVFDASGAERLTTQLYFQGDEYLDCDPFAHTSLAVPFAGTDEWVASDVNLVLA